MKYILDDLKNRLDFFLRNKLTFSGKNYSEKSQNIDDITYTSLQKDFITDIEKKYNIELLKNSTHINFLMNLYYLNIFEKYLSKNNKQPLSILDIGSKNWEYAKSEYLFFKSFCQDIFLDGIELDAYRLCTNFYNRFEIAKFHTKNLQNTNYIVGDFMEHNKKYNYIIWILPFITEYPLVKWGLPLKYFKPQAMLMHAYDLLEPSGELLIINQGEQEFEIQQELIKQVGLKTELSGTIEDVFGLFKNKRFYCKITKN